MKDSVLRLYIAYGFSKEDSKTIADVILTGDLYGIESHDVQRLIRYHREIQNGMENVKAKPEILSETHVSVLVEAYGAMGQLIGVYAMNLAIKKHPFRV